MKSILFSVLLASSATIAIATAADAPSLTGDWKVHISIVGNDSDMTCTFAQKEKDLTGSCKTDNGTVNITGSIDDKKVNWTYKSEYNGGPITLDYAGTIESAEKITGSVKVEEYSVEGDFTATVSK